MRLSLVNFFSDPFDVLSLVAQCDSNECFDRFWVGEHHSDHQVADPLAHALLMAGMSSRIRIGTGGVSLSHRNPYLVAETAILANLLFPNRIDLGVTRGQAGAGAVAQKMAESRAGDGGEYERDLKMLRDVLAQEVSRGQMYMDHVRSPGPPMFVMGTTQARAKNAAEWGVGFVASFHHGSSGEEILRLMRTYREAFKPSPLFAEPCGIVVVSGYVSDTAEEVDEARERAQGDGEPRAAGARSKNGILVFGPPMKAALDLRSLARGVCADEVMFLCLERSAARCYASLAAGWSASSEEETVRKSR